MKDVKRLLAWWKARLGKRKLFDLSAPIISKAKSDLSDGMQADGNEGEKREPGTVNRYLSALSTVLSEARKQWHWINDNPVRSVSKKREPKGRTRYLSDEERDGLITASEKSANPDLLPVVWLAITTGARRGGIMGLRWPQVDLKGEFVQFIDTKNGTSRSVGYAWSPYIDCGSLCGMGWEKEMGDIMIAKVVSYFTVGSSGFSA